MTSWTSKIKRNTCVISESWNIEVRASHLWFIHIYKVLDLWELARTVMGSHIIGLLDCQRSVVQRFLVQSIIDGLTNRKLAHNLKVKWRENDRQSLMSDWLTNQERFLQSKTPAKPKVPCPKVLCTQVTCCPSIGFTHTWTKGQWT
jgi:hypothetical protein